MRHVQVTVPTGKLQPVEDLLDGEGIDYTVTEESDTPEYDAIVEFPVTNNAVEPILDDLKGLGIDAESHIVVFEIQTILSDDASGGVAERTSEGVEREQISRQELITRADELTPPLPLYLVMTLLSAIVATVGLLLDSAAVVVGSMVIAPLVGPAMATSIGTIVNERDLFRTGFKYQVAGVLVGVVGAAVFAWLLQALLIVPPGTEVNQIGELAERITPNILLLPVALAAGIAGVLSLAMGFSMVIVGVMIAAALVPPIAAAGIAISWGLPIAAVGSGVIVLLNLLGINLAGLLTLWYVGYRPGRWFEISMAHRKMLRQVVVLGVVIVGLTVFLGGVAYTSYQVTAFEDTAEGEANSVLADYENLEVVEVNAEIQERQTTYGLTYSLSASKQIDLVTVEISGPPGAYDPSIADELYYRINEHTGGDTVVRVRLIMAEERGDEEPTPGEERDV